ncbi:MFS transporter [Amaricoccus sp.]|uniref:MFS transporter n=1 Tax=Amaricoccus sp. TaxID=1872485 RepID=UPI001B513896|nr:MFS transporter [Amaricoccus sp.]MBP7240787.1 MFS transporter [Amaricoccus sp.]
MRISFDEALETAGAGRFQRRLLGIFGLVWAADAMQVLAVGFTAGSIAKSFGLTVPQALQTGTLFFLGMLIGATVFGRLADRFGRRNVLIWTVAGDAVFGLLSVFAPSFAVLLVFRLLTGIAVGGTLPVDYAMMAEFLPARNRGRWLVILEGFWAVGTVAVAMVAWWAASAGATEPWRWIFAATAAPAFVGFWLRMRLPESPLYLLNAGRNAEARAVVDRLLVANGKPALGPGVELTHAATAPGGSLFTPDLRRRSVMILAVWFLVSLAYYGVFVWVPAKLAADGFGFVRGFGFLVLVALAQLPGYALAAYGVEKWGRKPTLIGFLVLSAAGCLMFTFAGSSGMVAVALLLMSFALLGSWGGLYAYTPELYPTGKRATGMGTAGAMARLGALLAPSALGLLFVQSFAGTIGFFAVLLMVAAVATALIDVETRARALA